MKHPSSFDDRERKLYAKIKTRIFVKVSFFFILFCRVGIFNKTITIKQSGDSTIKQYYIPIAIRKKEFCFPD